ncbi:MAG: class I SAM-dependent methyltransferase [Gammaproteobacteria bacterium]|jgi:SAM-dependent methyltransferase|nr:class I SAM-dependent methyltransferase [Gammaproteobacteria bacterium]MBU2181065.1 class I SAM-dependent methyltransferase [Gammaproteobacteria bacterium]MBU2225795.1 class I SAM-dependent methyltransferase [Gammaproteobacteria bacterium]
MNDLDKVASEYQPNAVTAIENDLILHWYPKRIIERFGYCDRLLELGLGHGFTAQLFNAATAHHVIVEGSQLVIDRFEAANPDLDVELVFSYFEEYESDIQFDVIIMGFILEHVDDPELILQRYRKYLKPDGRIFVAVPNAKSMNRRLGLELGLITDIYSLNDNDHALGHKRQYCRDTLKMHLQNQGYKVVYEEGIYLKPLPLNVLKNLDNFEQNLQAMLKVGIEFPDLCVGLLMEVELS